MKRLRRVLLLVLLVGAVVGTASYTKDHRKEYHWYHLWRISRFGDLDKAGLLKQYGVKFIPEAHTIFPHRASPTAMYPTWGFRVPHAVPQALVPVTDDTNGDGIPEVYIGSYSPKVYALDGRDGSVLWDWSLPHGVVGNIAMAVTDLDNDQRKELVFGTHWSWPIRVYALHTDQELAAEERQKWVRNVYGDFIEGGFNIADYTDKQYVVVATRDSPVSRGTFNVIAPNGRFAFRPKRGLDVCLNRPAVSLQQDTNRMYAIHGSHNYYGAEYGHRITARDLLTGKVLWSTPMSGDTGFQNHQIVDLDFDGHEEIIGFAQSQPPAVLNSATGAVLPGTVMGRIVGTIDELRIHCFSTPQGVTCQDATGRDLYTLPQLSFGIRFVEDQQMHLIALSHAEGTLHCRVYSAATGALEQHLKAPLTVPLYEDRSAYGNFSAPTGSGVAFNTLTDTDTDGYWDALVQHGDVLVNIHLPFPVHPSYDPYAPIIRRNRTNAGAVYNVPPAVITSSHADRSRQLQTTQR